MAGGQVGGVIGVGMDLIGNVLPTPTDSIRWTAEAIPSGVGICAGSHP